MTFKRPTSAGWVTLAIAGLCIAGLADVDGNQAVGVSGIDAFLLTQAPPDSLLRDGISLEVEAKLGPRVGLVESVGQAEQIEVIE